jgi:hypothetical protein
MTQEFEEFKKIKEMLSKQRLTDTAAEMVRKQVEAISTQSEAAKYAESLHATLKPKLGYDVSAAINENLSISNQLKNEIDKYSKHMTAGIQQYSESEKMIEDLKFQSNLTKSRASDFATDKNLSKRERIESAPFINAHQFQKNPIHETNEKLDKVQQNIEDLRPMAVQAAQLINSLNQVAVKMQMDSIKNATTTRNYAILAIFLSAIGILVSSYFSIKTNNDSDESSRQNALQLKAFQSEIHSITAAQKDGNIALVKSINDATNRLTKLDKK